MTLTALDRKNLSKKYVLIPEENQAASENIVQLNLLLGELEALDSSFKNLFDIDNDLVNYYHPELDRLLGNIRTSILEADLQNSAKKVPGNFFFPLQSNVSTPSLPDGIWKELKAYARNIAVGKTYQEAYAAQDSELDKISAVTTLTSHIQSTYSQTERQTGNPDNPLDPPLNLPTDLQNLKEAVDSWETWLLAQEVALLANLDSLQASEIAIALQSIEDTLLSISAWRALPDIAVGGKVDNSGLAILNNRASTRSTYIPTRIAEIENRLGDIVQATDGTVTLLGLYGNRYVNIDSRINLADGTLSKITGIELAKRVQNETILNNDAYLAYLTNSVLIATKLTAPGDGTNVIEVEDVSQFSISDIVYIVSETQAEITGTIVDLDIDHNTITLDFSVPTDFVVSDLSRMVKEV